jgi:hypothetical protein
MSTNTIDTEKTATLEPGAPLAKGKRTAAKEGQAPEEGRPGREAGH